MRKKVIRHAPTIVVSGPVYKAVMLIDQKFWQRRARVVTKEPTDRVKTRHSPSNARIKMTRCMRPDRVTQGFREDCAKLIARFEALETVRFKGFTEIWRDTKFSLVFGGRKSLIESIEFCEDSLAVAKEFFLPPLSFKERIGGLYLLYALYFKMPVTGPKIRTKMEDWQDIIEIRAEIIQAEHHDAGYILAKLMSENAFVHCPLERELGLEKSFRPKIPRPRNTYSVVADLRELAGPRNLFHRINVSSEYYDSVKASEIERLAQTGKGNNGVGKYLNLYDSNFGKKVLATVEQIEKSRKFTDFRITDETRSAHDDRVGYGRSWEAKANVPQKSHANRNPRRNHFAFDFQMDSVSECEKLSEPIVSDSSVSE